MPMPSRIKAQARRHRLLALLADGKFHSGERLARRLRISRAGVWKQIEALRELGVEIQSVAHQGYRLPRPTDLLSRDLLLSMVNSATRASLERIDVLFNVDSTNRFVNDAPPVPPGKAALCVTELQTAGRGRRGRSWIAPFGSGVCMSIGWQFEELPPTFSALSLAVGVAVVRALRRLGAHAAGLKWPNDLIAQQRKLGGILIEMRGEAGGPSHVVIGIGINTHMPTSARLQLAEQQATLLADLHELLREASPTRNQVVAAIADEVVAMLRVFAVEGFAPFAAEWRSLDVLADAPVKVLNGQQTTLGIARGVDVDGTMLVECDGELRRFVSGDVSLRAAR